MNTPDKPVHDAQEQRKQDERQTGGLQVYPDDVDVGQSPPRSKDGDMGAAPRPDAAHNSRPGVGQSQPGPTRGDSDRDSERD